MIELTPEVRERLQAVLDGKVVQCRLDPWHEWHAVTDYKHMDLPGYEYCIKPNQVEALAKLALSSLPPHVDWDEMSDEGRETYRKIIRALAKVCPALLEVEL